MLIPDSSRYPPGTQEDCRDNPSFPQMIFILIHIKINCGLVAECRSSCSALEAFREFEAPASRLRQ